MRMSPEKMDELFTEAFNCEMIVMNRKPGDRFEIEDTDYSTLPDLIQDAMMDLPEVELTEDLYNEWGFFADILDPNESQYYIVTYEDDVYFVDNQGYEYCRYITRLTNINY